MDTESLEKSIRDEIERSASFEALEQARIKYLGRKGVLTSLLRNIKEAPQDERPRLGAVSNRLKELAEGLISEKLAALRSSRVGSRFYSPPPDATLPAHDGMIGRRHVLSQVLRQLKEIFFGMGYSLA